jgi:DNA-binding IclR family transcriptional regulator
VISKSVGRAFELLSYFREVKKSLRAKDIEAALAMPQASTSALLTELRSLGILAYDSGDRSYFPTARLAMLGDWLNDALFGGRHLIPVAEAIAAETGETVSICARDDLWLDVLYSAQGRKAGAIYLPLGRGAPLARSVTGRALLAGLSRTEIEEILERTRSLQKRRKLDNRILGLPNAIDRKELLLAAGTAKAQGFLVGYDMATAGVGAVVILVNDVQERPTLALAVAGMTQRIRDAETSILRTARKALREAGIP